MLRGVERADVVFAIVDKVVCATAVKALLGLRRKREGAMAAAAARKLRTTL